MQKSRVSSSVSAILVSLLLFAATVCGMTGCGTVAPEESGTESLTSAGTVSFTLEVIDGEGNRTTYPITTDKSSVAAALTAEGLVSGEDGPYGLVIKTVCGITADYDTDGKYWAFYIDGEYAMTGADMTTPTDGAVYTLKVE